MLRLQTELVTFEEAAESYMKQGGSPRYLEKAVDYFRGQLVSEIHPAHVREFALKTYPKHLPGSRNRQGITPPRAVLYHAHDMGWRGPMRIRGFRTMKSKKHQPVDDAWLDAFLRQADEDGLHRLAACVLFMNQTAARVSEAVNLRGRYVDLVKKIAILARTKTELHANAYLTDELVDRLRHLSYGPDDLVFGYKGRFSINERIEAVCKRAELVYRPSHSVGRHSFATNALNLGVGVRKAMDAGRWKCSSVFLETYQHTENAGREVAEIFERRKSAGTHPAREDTSSLHDARRRQQDMGGAGGLAGAVHVVSHIRGAL